MLLGLIYAIIIVIILAWLHIRGYMSRRLSLLLLMVSLIVTGPLLGGVPDPVTPIAQVVHGMVSGGFGLALLIGLAALIVITLLAGRAFCGYVCPLGVSQELLSRLGLRRIKIGGDRSEKVRLLMFPVFMLLFALTEIYVRISPFQAFSLVPATYSIALFSLIAIASLFLYRPWCTLLCPFGAIASLAARASPFRPRIDAGRCVECGLCKRICPTVQPLMNDSMSECYQCNRCVEACPKDAIEVSFRQ